MASLPCVTGLVPCFRQLDGWIPKILGMSLGLGNEFWNPDWGLPSKVGS